MKSPFDKFLDDYGEAFIALTKIADATGGVDVLIDTFNQTRTALIKYVYDLEDRNAFLEDRYEEFKQQGGV